MAGYPPLARLLAKIDIREEDQCWPWLGHKNYLGYGKFLLDGKCVSAHRAVMLLVKGEQLTYDLRRQDGGPPKKGSIGAKRLVRHLCNNRSCCNPKHLEYSNNSRNMLDAVAAGTFKGNQRLTPTDYVAILASSEPAAILAKRFGVGRGHVYKIRYGVIAAAGEAHG